ncbi:MAG: hypothetical protein ACJ0HA_03815 [Dehalococcoidia bacterium]|tara:strand:+ start:203 stop:871 length:669 start_codon:yes stop_codon:yes gene_type:complete
MDNLENVIFLLGVELEKGNIKTEDIGKVGSFLISISSSLHNVQDVDSRNNLNSELEKANKYLNSRIRLQNPEKLVLPSLNISNLDSSASNEATTTIDKNDLHNEDANEVLFKGKLFSEQNKILTNEEILTVSSYLEKTNSKNQPMMQLNFKEKIKVDTWFNEDFGTPRWDEYNVSSWVFEENKEIYESVKKNSRVLVKLIFEQKNTSGALKNFQNCEIIKVL